MDDLSGCKVIHIDSRRRVALQCVDLLAAGRDAPAKEEDRRPDTCHVRRRAFEEGAQAPEAHARATGRPSPHPRSRAPTTKKASADCSCPSVRFAGKSTCRADSRTTRTKDSSATTRCAPPDR